MCYLIFIFYFFFWKGRCFETVVTSNESPQLLSELGKLLSDYRYMDYRDQFLLYNRITITLLDVANPLLPKPDCCYPFIRTTMSVGHAILKILNRKQTRIHCETTSE